MRRDTEQRAGQRWVRFSEHKQSRLLVLIFCSRNDQHTIRMQVGQMHFGATHRALLPGSEEVVSVDQDGWGTFATPPNGVQVWVAT